MTIHIRQRKEVIIKNHCYFYTLKKCVERCVELLNVSIKGDNIQRKLNAISEENDSSYSESMKDINEHRDEVTSRIKELYKEKDTLNDKIRKEQVKLETKEEKENENELYT